MGKRSLKLLDKVAVILGDLASFGWAEVLMQHGLDITSKDLEHELTRPLSNIVRTAAGFEGFTSEGTRGIEAGRPAMSLLWHALASPNVTSFIDENGIEKPIKRFPEPVELEVIENFVYGINPPTIDELRARAGDAPLAIVVFAQEFRPAINTAHRLHSDMCYSRTGIARVGTEKHKYLSSARGYLPFVDNNGTAIRVLPCRYAPYIAALVPGDKDRHGPMRYREPGVLSSEPSIPAKRAGLVDQEIDEQDTDPGDQARSFWVPMHKLFEGNECLSGHNLDVSLKCHHVNEKLRRIHLFFLRHLHDGGWGGPDISNPPFRFTEGIAGWSTKEEDGTGLLVPTVHATIVAPAKYKGSDLTYNVPSSKVDPGEPSRPVFGFSSSLALQPLPTRARSAPEYIHARTAVDWGGKGEKDLNEEPNVEEIVVEGGYKAKHYLDFTGDGWIDVECRALALEVPHRLSAFSLVAAVDYFPGVKQRDLMQWWEQSVPSSVKDTIWPSSPGAPQVLSDQRLVANIELEGAGFSDQDDTMTAVVSALETKKCQQMRVLPPKNRRSSMLPDGASGIYAPGWDSSIDHRPERENQDGGTDPEVYFLASYGLGSPFPEDAKLCAALSAFWPAVSPDTERTFEPMGRYATTTPLTDDLLGQNGEIPWDGVAGPRVLDEKKKIIEYNSLAYGDYVTTALANGFNLTEIGKITPQEYIARTVVMARVYQSLGALTTKQKVGFAVLSFTNANPGDDTELQQAMKQTNRLLADNAAFRIVIYEPQPVEDQKHKPFNKSWRGYETLNTYYADPNTVLLKDANGDWKSQVYHD